jgi:hypothetical protein
LSGQAIGRARLMLQWQETDCHLDFERVLLAQFQEEKRTRQP